MLGSGGLWFAGIAEGLTSLLAVALAAYFIVGVIEVLGGQSIEVAAENWFQQPAWKKVAISILVISVALMGFMSLIPMLAK